MIRSISLALVFSLFLFSVAEAKVAAVPMNQVIQESEMGKAAQKLIKDSIGAEQIKFEQDSAKFQKAAQEFQKQAAALSEKTRVQKAQELGATERSLYERRNVLAQKVTKIQKELNKQIFEIVAEASEKVGKSKRLDIIMDSTPPMAYYVADSANIESALLTEINKIWKKKGSKFEM